MLTISIKSDVDRAMPLIRLQTEKQVSYAIRKAVNKTAEDVRQAEYAEMKAVFDRPTPWTLKGVGIDLAKTDPPTAHAYLKYSGSGTPAEKFLKAEIEGGPRSLKRFERALQTVGLMPPGYFAVPGEAAPLDQYGNIPASFIRRMLSYLQAGEVSSGYFSNITKARKEKLRRGTKARQGYTFFVEQHRVSTRRPLGIYMTSGRYVRPMVIFVRSPNYKPLLKWEVVARRTVANNFPMHFTAAMAEALRRGQ